MATGASSKQGEGEEGSKYVLVKADNAKNTPETGNSNTEVQKDCPEIVYKVQYKDYTGEIKGTKILDAPYKLSKPVYGYGDGVPILEVLYSVSVWFPKIYKRNKNNLEASEKKDEEGKDVFDEKSMEERELIIHSELLIKALRAIVDYYPGQSLLGEPITIKEPFSILVHHREELQKYKESCDDAETFHHISVLQKYLEDNLGDKILEEDARYAKPAPVATFEMLWMLFKPGMDVYSTIDEQRGGFVVQSCGPAAGPSQFGRPSALKITMWYLDFDGRMVGRRRHEVNIIPFEGEREITSLKVFPAKFLDRDPELSPRKRLEDRGEKFYSLLIGKQMDYKGYSMPVKEKPKRFHEGRVVVDQGSFYTYADYNDTCLHPAPNFDVDDDDSGILADLHYDCNCDECTDKRRAASSNTKWGSYQNIDPKETPDLSTDKDGNPTRHRYFLLPRRIMGFDLKSKKWQALDIDFCREPKIKKEAIENLVLPSDKQELIRALVHKYSHSRNKTNKLEATWSADPIPNKGEGQIFLLHGPPGAGKTFTAECVAEFTSRPLLSLTCGDIGTYETTVEENLSKWFKLAEIWGAVMLIDEADVYLERREVDDLSRNGLVSVFLRALEYYRGILFMTTNRVGHFDPAFFSRIHVYIGYKPLDAEGRKRIWNQFFQKLEIERANEVSVKAGAKRYVFSDDVLQDIDWNGREIRNAFQTAVALAEYEAMQKVEKRGGKDVGPNKETLEIELRQDHFEKVVEMSQNFKKYMATVSEENRGDRGDDALL
ncbi:hypothetical protein BJ875DRAFT_385474 [Amylocarpus encephaloides]|uniref:AAA+ ATPase domain-containing protein n=1 Tax=Amylocarpus encephaloides TaxID=45428 RepID=A0A9P8C1G5_9HELO|nr:hypothetical protein BJ875DRAFT_385474 [Amylocarpus encephaloides]